MIPLLTSEQMRALDAHAIDVIGIPGVVLMENAARGVIEVVEEHFDVVEALTVAVICGPGNNGGDGFAVARQLHLRGADVDVFLLCDEKSIKDDALTNYLLLEPLGITTMPWNDAHEGVSLAEYDLIIDAMFGTGSVRPLQCPYKKVIEAVNEAEGLVISIDVPSGVDATTGGTTGPAVSADVTVTFQCAKVGLLLPPGRDLTGDLVVAPISIPEMDEVLAHAPFGLPEDADLQSLLPARARDAHKGDFGNLLVIAGSFGMSGAARLVSMAALRTGVGLVKCASPLSIRSEIAGFRPEIMTIGLPETSAGTIAANAIETLIPYLEWADVIAVGPGLGQSPETARFLEVLFTYRKPFVIDADALNLIAAHKLLKKLPADAILTPHPGEFDRLVAVRHESFTARLAAARQFAVENSVTLLLKGSPTVTFDPSGYGVINPTGNPGLATAGSGDVLTGIIASLRAQGLESYPAAWIGAYLHGRSADLAVKETGEASLVAGDVIQDLPAAFASLQPDDESDERNHGCKCGGHCK
jgi:ADP-dependent NAD(P)H-hydrate dehydratase / NAD(P)H-hydrate epimerase